MNGGRLVELHRDWAVIDMPSKRPERARPDHRQQFDQRQRHDVP
jgi:hypothetical protein